MVAGVSDREAVRGDDLGDTLALLGNNRYEWLETLSATSVIGTVLVPINWHFSVDEIAYVIENSGATALVADAEIAESAAQPVIQKRSLPPKKLRSLEKTILSAKICLIAKKREALSPLSTQRAYSFPTSIAQSNIFPFKLLSCEDFNLALA